jgi:hypothetical protein
MTNLRDYRLPNFLVIGAQKAGTTTFFADLNRHPSVYMPQCKEVGDLRYDAVLRREGIRSYAEYFRLAKPEQICGEASTAYSRMSEFSGVPERALAVCGASLKILYLVRDPMARILSHYSHAWSLGDMPYDFEIALREDPRLLDTSRYAMQLEAWLKCFPARNFRVVRFEGFITDREAVMREVFEFLGLDSSLCASFSDVENSAEQRRVMPALLYPFAVSKFYKSWLKEVIPPGVRALARRHLTVPARLPDIKLSLGTQDWILAMLAADQMRLSVLLGLTFENRCLQWSERFVRQPVGIGGDAEGPDSAA